MKQKISRQRAWQIKRRAEGRCVQCGKKAVTANHCRQCRDRMNKYALAYYYRKKKIIVDNAEKSTKKQSE